MFWAEWSVKRKEVGVIFEKRSGLDLKILCLIKEVAFCFLGHSGKPSNVFKQLSCVMYILEKWQATLGNIGHK